LAWVVRQLSVIIALVVMTSAAGALSMGMDLPVVWSWASEGDAPYFVVSAAGRGGTNPEPGLKSLELEAKGIACISCAIRIKKTVGGMEGVKRVDVSAVARKIHVEYDGGMVTEEEIIRKIDGLGFQPKKVRGPDRTPGQ
jgi:copper chaperone CopZ